MSSLETSLDFPVIDSGIVHDWPSLSEIAEYISPEWRELLLRPYDDFGPMVPRVGVRYPDAVLAEGQAAAYSRKLDLDELCREFLDVGLADRLVLLPDSDSRVGALTIHQLARTVASATNDWTIEEWLARDSRLFGIAVIPNQVPEDAAAEIRRIGDHPQIVGVALGANTLHRRFGHAIYYPIYEAAADLDLPLVLHASSDAAILTEATLSPTGGGMPSTYAEARVLNNHGHWSHVSSMIYQGVFNRFPDLKLLLVGGGAAWIPGYLWRLDYWHKAAQLEQPHVHELPSNYFMRHCRISTWGLESPARAEQLVNILNTLPAPGAASLLMYASRHPLGDSESPAVLSARIPESWHRRVFRDNAAEFFRWPAAATTAVGIDVSAVSPEGSSRA